MAIRFPTLTVLDKNDSGDVGAGSVAGGVGYTFILPQDTDNVVVKFTASTVGGAVSAVFQTSDDGGTTFYDVARTSVVSNANNTTAEWLTATTSGTSAKSQRTFGGSILTGTIGSAAASTLGQGQYSGLPILGQTNRVFLIYTGNLTANTLSRVQVIANNQSATA